jgi:hypothetical protein
LTLPMASAPLRPNAVSPSTICDRGFAASREIPSAECDWESIRAVCMHHFSTRQYSPSFLSLSDVTSDSG